MAEKSFQGRYNVDPGPIFPLVPWAFLFFFLVAVFTCAGSSFPGHLSDTLSTPHPSREALAVYRYLLDMKGKLILSGQQDSPWGIDELAYIKTHTGKQPVLRGMDFIHAGDNAGEVQKAISWWKAGGIPTIMWHWGAPTKGDGYEQSKMTIDINRCFEEGTAEYIAFRRELEMKAGLLQQLEDARVPVLWRPFHEFDGNWFWWSKQGPMAFKKLWTTMHDYYVKECGLSNLIWVLCYTSTVDPAWYPGDQYVDVVGADTYNSGDGPQAAMYLKSKEVSRDRLPIAYHECGIPPDPDECLKQGIMWSWWMEWHTDWLTELDRDYLKKVYTHHLVVTLDEVPPIMTYYGWEGDSCRSSSLAPFRSIDGGEAVQGTFLTVHPGSSALLIPRADGEGSWSWSGLGTPGSQATQTIPLDVPGMAKGTFINGCGAASTVVYYVADTCDEMDLVPRFQIQGTNWAYDTLVRIPAGKYLRLSPLPTTGGSWKWIRGSASTQREITVYPRDSVVYTAQFTNNCGQTARISFYVAVENPTPARMSARETSFRIYPVPCREVLHIEGDGMLPEEMVVVTVYTLTGTLLLERDLHGGPFLLDVSGLRPATYLLHIRNRNRASYLRFIVG
jgi:hypothetical protein